MKNFTVFMETIKNDINDFITYNGYDFRLTFEVSEISSHDGETVLSCISREMDIQIFGDGEYLQFIDDEMESTDVSDYDIDEILELLIEFIENNYCKSNM